MKVLGLDIAKIEEIEKKHNVRIEVDLSAGEYRELILRTWVNGGSNENFVITNANLYCLQGPGKLSHYVEHIVLAQATWLDTDKIR